MGGNLRCLLRADRAAPAHLALRCQRLSVAHEPGLMWMFGGLLAALLAADGDDSGIGTTWDMGWQHSRTSIGTDLLAAADERRRPAPSAHRN
jgi:hypothetical protein